ncbi:MAG: hypothetical protein AB7F40_04975 [Victivallaceae bacterium]
MIRYLIGASILLGAYFVSAEDVVKSYDFQDAKLKVGQLDKNQKEVLARRKISETLVAETMVPTEFMLDVYKSSFAPGNKVMPTARGLHIQTTGRLNFFTKEKFSTVGMNDYLVEVEFLGHGNLSIGAYCYHSDKSMFPIEFKDFKSDSDDLHKVTDMLVEKDRLDIYNFRVGFVVEGDITLKSITILRRFDDCGSLVDGTLVDVSPLPSALTSDYPDCYYTAEFEINSILGGQSLPQRISLVIPGFANYKLLPSGKFKAGDKLVVKLRPFDKLTPEQQSIQQADSLQNYDLDCFFLCNAKKVDELSSSKGDVLADGVEYKSRFASSVNPPLPAAAVEERSKQMAAELKELTARLDNVKNPAELNARFNKVWKENQKKYQRMVEPFYTTAHHKYEKLSNLFWGRVGKGLFALPENYYFYHPYAISAANIKALKAFNDYMALNNIQFIVVLIPNSYAVSARMLNPEFRDIPDACTATMAVQLLENGVEAVYCIDRILELGDKYEYSFMYPENIHPDWGCQHAVAQLLAPKLQRLSGVLGNKIPASSFSHEKRQGWSGTAFRYPSGVDIGEGKPDAMVLHDFVLINGKEKVSDPGSSILVIGNSFVESPMPSGGLNMAIAEDCGYLPQRFWMGSRSVFYTLPVTLLLRRNEFLTGKKVCILSIFAPSLHGESFVNVRDFDSLRSQMAGCKLVKKLSIPRFDMDIAQAPISAPNHYRERWQRLLYAGGKSAIMLKGENDERTVIDQPLPPEVDPNKDLFVVLRIVSFPDQYNFFKIDGVEYPLGSAEDNATWQTRIIKIDPHKRLNLKLQAKAASGLVAIKDISLYQ